MTLPAENCRFSPCVSVGAGVSVLGHEKITRSRLTIAKNSTIQQILTGALFAGRRVEDQMMKSATPALAILLLTVIAFLMGASSDGIAQTPGVIGPWAYAYIANINGSAVEVAYIEGDNCRIEKIHVPVNNTNRVGVNFGATRVKSAATAMAALSQDGWEMVGAGFAYCHYSDIEAIHFRRR
jgi:hypothetical protein